MELYDRPRFSNMPKFTWWSWNFSYHQRVCNLREFSNSYETAHRTEKYSAICRRQCKTELKKKTVGIICCYMMSDAAKFENPNTLGFCAKSNTAVVSDSVNNTNLREEKGLSSEKIKSTDWDNLVTLLQERIIINSSTALKQWEQLNILMGEHTENGSCLGKFAQG